MHLLNCKVRLATHNIFPIDIFSYLYQLSHLIDVYTSTTLTLEVDMLNVSMPVTGTPSHFADRIFEQLIRYVLYSIDMQHIFGDTISLLTDYRAPSTTVDKDGNALLSTKDELRCMARINYNSASVPWEMPFSSAAGGIMPHQRSGMLWPIFYDPLLRTNLTMHGELVGLTVELTFKSNRAAVILDVQSRIKQKFTFGEMFIAPDLSFNYAIPPSLLGILLGLIRIQGLKDSDFLPYLKTHSDRGLELNINRNVNTLREVVATHSLVNLNCKLEVGGDAPEVNKLNQQIESVTQTYTLTTQFCKPAIVTIEYPPVINNTMVPYELVFASAQGYSKALNRVSPFLKLGNHPITEGYVNTREPIVHFPWYDDWYPKQTSITTVCGYAPIISQIFTLDDIDNPDGVTEIDLTQIADGTVLDTVLESLFLNPAEMFYHTQNLCVTVYQDEIAVEPASLGLSGTTITVPCRDIRRVYRLVVSIKKELISNGIINAIRVLETTIVAAKRNRS